MAAFKAQLTRVKVIRVKVSKIWVRVRLIIGVYITVCQFEQFRTTIVGLLITGPINVLRDS